MGGYLTPVVEYQFPHHINLTNITEKDFVRSIFSRGISDNLLEIAISGENLYDYFESDILFGSNINYSYEFEKILELNDINIDYFKFQPFSSSSVVTFRYPDIIEINPVLDNGSLSKLIDTIYTHISNYLNSKRW